MTGEHGDGVLDGRDRSDAVVLSYSPAGQPARRVTFLPRSATGPDWERVTEQRRNGAWHFVGSEPVETVSVEVGSDE